MNATALQFINTVTAFTTPKQRYKHNRRQRNCNLFLLLRFYYQSFKYQFIMEWENKTKMVQLGNQRYNSDEANAYGYPNFKGEKHEAFNDGFLAGSNFANERQPYTAKDLSEFAEWCNGNSWLYANYSKLWTNIGGVQKITSQLREQWEIETGRRKRNETE